MPYYYVNKNAQSGGEHEIHTTACKHGPVSELKKLSLGFHSVCKGAKKEAKRHYSHVDGCYYCCNDCHNE